MSALEQLEAEARWQHPEESDAEIARRVAYRAATLKPLAGLPAQAGSTEKHSRRSWSVATVAWHVLKILWALAVLLLLGTIAAKAQETSGYRAALATVRLLEAPAFDAPIIFLSNGGTQLAVVPAGKVIFNCSTNMACSWNSTTRQFDLTASSTASTAFSALTASLNTNAGTFSASGNSWDFSGVTLFKLRVGAACTTSANGDICFDSTNSRWKLWQTADRFLISSTNLGTSGQVAISNADGSATFADPIVSGPAAEGAAPVNNPVWIAGKGADGFIHSVRMANDGTVRTDPTGTTTQPISAASLPLPSGAAQEHTTAASPHATRLTDGTAFYKATTPADTQPVSGTVTANAGTGTFSNQQTNVAEDYDTGAGTQNVTKFGIALPASGGSVAGGTSTNPIRVDPTGTTTQPVSGTVTANAGTGTFTVGQATGTNLHMVCDSGCGGSGGTSSSFNAAFPATGTAAGASDGTNMKPLLLDASGFLKVNVAAGGGSGGTSSSYGAAFPATGTAAGFTDGTNMQGAKVFDLDTGAGSDYNQGISLRLSASGGSVEGGTATNPVRIDPTGTTTQPVSGTVTANIGTSGSLALDASVTGLQVAQGSTTTGQKGELMQGAVTTSPPTYTSGQTDPLSLTTAGALRVDGSGVTQPVSGTVTANQGTANATPWNENLAQVGGTATVNGGVAGTLGVGGATAAGSAVAGNPIQVAGNASGTVTRGILCDNWKPINQTANTQIIAGAASKQTYICSVFLFSASAQNINIVEGTGTTCGTGTAGLTGGATAATGPNLAANQGFVMGPGWVPWLKTATAADNVCLFQSGTGQISGVVTWTQF